MKTPLQTLIDRLEVKVKNLLNNNMQIHKMGKCQIDTYNTCIEEAKQLLEVEKEQKKPFVIRDYTCGGLHDFSSYDEAKAKFDAIKKETEGHECDMQLYFILEEVNNID